MRTLYFLPFRAAAADLASFASSWWMRQRFLSIRMRFYQDYLDSRMLMRSFAQARAEQLRRRGDAAYLAVNEVAGLLRQGRPVAEALRPVAPPADVGLIQAFEQSNRLEEGFRHLVLRVRDETRLRNEVLSALTRPVIYLVLALAMLTAGIPEIVGSMGPLLDRSALTLDQRALLQFSGFMHRFAGLIIPALVSFAALSVVSLPSWTGALRRRADAFSPLHRMYRAYHAAAFLQVLAIQLSVTPQLDRALAVIADNSSPWLRFYIAEILRALPHSRVRPMDAFDVGLLDPVVLDSLALISRSGTAEEAIALRAELSTQSAIDTIRKTAMALQHAVVCVAGALLIWIAVSLVFNLIKTNMDRLQQIQPTSRKVRRPVPVSSMGGLTWNA